MYRCPEHENRPNFNEICTYLRQPPAQLITLDQLYPFLSSKANILGEELEHGKQLYLDLQHKYEEVTNWYLYTSQYLTFVSVD